jgi:dihydrofolate reductase
MGKVRFDISLSLDGFMAGPGQSVENPIGTGGMALFEWAFPLAAFRALQGREGGEVNESTPVVEERFANAGAYILGRNMFGGGSGPWPDDPPWNGWWGDEPPYHAPVFVLTHHPREPVPMRGGTTFTFVTDGIESALEQARAAARDRDVVIGGGAATIRQYLAAGLVDELNLSLVPILLGSGERPFDDLPDLRLEQVRVVEAPGVTHLRYRVTDRRERRR